MNPFYFGDSASPLYGVYHAPGGDAFRNTCVLLCYPAGHEYMRAHRPFRLLAEKLSARGLPVMRFDYYATGDSSGARGDGTLDRWLEDVRVAAQELKDLSGATRVSIVGLRLGAAMASLACREDLAVKTLVLWDPVVNGRAYAEELRDLEKDRLQHCREWYRGEQGTREGAEEVLGYAYPAGLMESIEGADLLERMPRAEDRVEIVTSDNRDDCSRLRDALNGAGIRAGFRHIPDGGQWRVFEKSGGALLAGHIVQGITDALAGDAK